MHTTRLVTASGKPVCRYGLGGAARSVQPESLPIKYRDLLSQQYPDVAPFYFYYNPHRYPEFLSGVAKSFSDEEDRKDMFIASGGDRSPASLDRRLSDALAYSGGDYLDAFVLEYVCPYELSSDNKQLSGELQQAIEHVHKMKKDGKVRYVMASTHSHLVGSMLASATLDDASQAFDALMLRYNMSHKIAAESMSLPNALQHNIPVLAFTTTRWNRLQNAAHMGGEVSTSDCIQFALHHPAVEAVLHSARDEEELDEALLPLFSASSSGQSSWISKEECERFRDWGSDEMEFNHEDAFDEYPEEMEFVDAAIG